MKTIGYIVTQGGYPCTVYNASRSAETKRGGILVPGDPVEYFYQKRDAKRAIDRTKRVAESLAGSLVDDWIKTMPLLSGKPYEILPLIKQADSTDNHTKSP